jgi:hypothetical protein
VWAIHQVTDISKEFVIIANAIPSGVAKKIHHVVMLFQIKKVRKACPKKETLLYSDLCSTKNLSR